MKASLASVAAESVDNAGLPLTTIVSEVSSLHALIAGEPFVTSMDSTGAVMVVRSTVASCLRKV